MSAKTKSNSNEGQVEYLNPEALHVNPAYSQLVSVTGPVRTLYIGGQDAVDQSGEIVGVGDLKVQTAQVLRNLQAALAAGGAGPEHVVKWNVYLVQGQSIQDGFEAFREVWGDRPNPPVITSAFVAGLAHPDFLVEMDAIAVVPVP